MIQHLQNMSHQKIYTFWYCVANDEAPSTYSQIVEQIDVIQGVVLPWISKLNDSAPDKKQGGQTQFFPKKNLEKGKWIWYCQLYLRSHQLMERVIEKQIHKFYKDFFHLPQNFYRAIKKKH